MKHRLHVDKAKIKQIWNKYALIVIGNIVFFCLLYFFSYRPHNRENRASEFLSMAQSAETRGRNEAAIELYQKVLSDYPHTRASSTAKQQLAELKHSLDQKPETPEPCTQTHEDINIEEMLADESVEPQWFLVNADGRHMGFEIPDTHKRTDREAAVEALVGKPLMFSSSQLDNLLPGRTASRLQDVSITLSFTVEADGDLADIEVIESNAPVRLERLVVDALRRVYYRPALVDGVPLAREGVRLVQTFNPAEGGVR